MKIDIRLELNRFTIQDILSEISRLSIEILKSRHEDEMQINNVKVFTYRDEMKKGKYITKKFPLTNWNLLDMAYYAIYNVSNAFTKYPFDREKFIRLVHVFISQAPDTPKKKSDFLLYLYGFIGEQHIFQTYHKIDRNFCRERYILDTFIETKEQDAIVMKEVGVTAEKLPLILYFLFVLISNDLMNHKIKLHGIQDDDILKVIDYYSDTVEGIRSSTLKRQKLYTTPFIKNINEYPVPVNAYLIYHIFQNCIYWVIRNHYFKLGSQKFTNDFGTGFEKYVFELLSEYLDESQFEKIPVSKTPRADFRVSLGEYNFLIEVKGTLAGLQSKQQESDVLTTKKFIERVIEEGITQLKNTEEIYSDKKYYKLIVTYENYYKSELLEVALQEKEIFINDGTYWLITVEELEQLLYVYKENYDLFQMVMIEKVKSEAEYSRNGRDIEQILGRLEYYDNYHLNQQKFTRYISDIKTYIEQNKYI